MTGPSRPDGDGSGAAVFHPGAVWLDSDGHPIQAHGGGLLDHEGRYYWFGENKNGPTYNQPDSRVDVIGVSCYSSDDLLTWRNEGIVLPARAADPTDDLHPHNICERPKVVYNAATRAFVMWMHIDRPGYLHSRAGVAVADNPTGPYEYLGAVRPDGASCTDLTVFQDDDGGAYLVFTTGGHRWIQISRLRDDWLGFCGDATRHFERPGPPLGREAPALFKRRGIYHLITSGTTGWQANPAEHAVATSLHGPWELIGNPCRGGGPSAGGPETTFNSQGTYVQRVRGTDTWLFLADRWNSNDLRDSRYVWLPMTFPADGVVEIAWQDSWSLARGVAADECSRGTR